MDFKTEEPKAKLELCIQAKSYIEKKDFETCKALLYKSMQEYPDSPEPHNLLGILLEKEGLHASAMRHFRAAIDLDPTYLPAKENLISFGTFADLPRKCFYGDKKF